MSGYNYYSVFHDIVDRPSNGVTAHYHQTKDNAIPYAPSSHHTTSHLRLLHKYHREIRIRVMRRIWSELGDPSFVGGGEGRGELRGGVGFRSGGYGGDGFGEFDGFGSDGGDGSVAFLGF